MADALRGRFVWSELLTTPPPSAAPFYKPVTGWQTAPWPNDLVNTLLTAGGQPVAGLMVLPEDAKRMGAPPHWLTYVGTSNVGGGRTICDPPGPAGRRLRTVDARAAASWRRSPRPRRILVARTVDRWHQRRLVLLRGALRLGEDRRDGHGPGDGHLSDVWPERPVGRQDVQASATRPDSLDALRNAGGRQGRGRGCHPTWRSHRERTDGSARRRLDCPGDRLARGSLCRALVQTRHRAARGENREGGNARQENQGGPERETGKTANPGQAGQEDQVHQAGEAAVSGSQDGGAPDREEDKEAIGSSLPLCSASINTEATGLGRVQPVGEAPNTSVENDPRREREFRAVGSKRC